MLLFLMWFFEVNFTKVGSALLRANVRLQCMIINLITWIFSMISIIGGGDFSSWFFIMLPC